MAGIYLAPAKVNLFLHVGAPSSDGFHPLCSAMVFAEAGDMVSIGSGPGVSVSGPFAADLEGGGDNLVARAMSAFSQWLPANFGLHLEKHLPVAAGLGGGSSDAGAAFRLMRESFAPDMPDGQLEALAATLGSDGAACLWARAVLAEGRGERLSRWSSLPVIHGVLVNPCLAVSTAAVYRRYDEIGHFSDVTTPDHPDAFGSVQTLSDWLAAARNDLQAAAVSIEPGIAEVLAELEANDGVLLARMSGSGATCFALCRDPIAAARVSDEIARTHADWWVQACRLS